MLMLTLSGSWSRANRRRHRSDERGSLIRNLLVPEKNRTFLNMPRAGGNGHEGQPQESFHCHLGNFEAVKFLRSHVLNDPLDRLARRLFFVETKNAQIGRASCRESG